MPSSDSRFTPRITRITMRFEPLLVLLGLAVACSLPLAHEAHAANEEGAGIATVLITGANRGIGFEFARQYAERGWRVIATARNPAAAIDLQALATQHQRVSIEQLDVTNPVQITALAEKYANEPVDVLLLNAAKGPQQPTATAPLQRQNFDVAEAYFATNAIGPMRVAQAFMKNVKLSGRKQVIAVSSDSGSFVAGSQLPILYHYKASKTALNMYIHTLSFEARKRGVTVIMLHPGMVATNAQTARLPGAMPTADSVDQMLDVIDNLTPADNGRFIDYRGEAMPW
jgi:NAD(P)-dependent dehydrogenase (short-subunit alcohol dehydrogenase family)